MKKIILSVSFILLILGVYAQNSILGTWYNTTKSAKVEIYMKGTTYAGKIVWLKEPIDDITGKPKTDENNPETSKQKIAIMSLIVLEKFSNDGDGTFSEGTIYDPENGKTYKCKMSMIDNNNLDVRGYIGIPAIGRTENWTRTTK